MGWASAREAHIRKNLELRRGRFLRKRCFDPTFYDAG